VKTRAGHETRVKARVGPKKGEKEGRWEKQLYPNGLVASTYLPPDSPGSDPVVRIDFVIGSSWLKRVGGRNPVLVFLVIPTRLSPQSLGVGRPALH
jgi:hypothetical protein